MLAASPAHPLRQLALALCAAQGLACDAAAPAPEPVAVRVGAVGFDERVGAPVILLEEIAGERVLPIWIGAAEARSRYWDYAHA